MKVFPPCNHACEVVRLKRSHWRMGIKNFREPKRNLEKYESLAISLSAQVDYPARDMQPMLIELEKNLLGFRKFCQVLLLVQSATTCPLVGMLQ